MNVREWIDLMRIERSEWLKSAPRLTYDGAMKVMMRILPYIGRDAESRKRLLDAGIWIGATDVDGVEWGDCDIEAIPCYVNTEGKLVELICYGSIAFG